MDDPAARQLFPKLGNSPEAEKRRYELLTYHARQTERTLLRAMTVRWAHPQRCDDLAQRARAQAVSAMSSALALQDPRRGQGFLVRMRRVTSALALLDGSLPLAWELRPHWTVPSEVQPRS